MTTSADILAPRSSAVVLAALLALFASKGMNANGWQSLQFARIVSVTQAETINSYEVNRAAIFDGGYISTATGVYLDLAATWYGEKRAAATTAIVQARFTDTAGAGPYLLAAGQIAVLDPTGVSGGPFYFRSSVAISVPKNGFVDVLFAGEAAGAGYNATPGSLSLKTPVPGVALTSPAIASTGAIIISAGVNAELDDLLRARCLLKLAQLGTGWAKATIAGLVLDNFPAVTRLLVRDPGGVIGVADAYIAGPSAPASSQTVLDVYAFLADEKRKPVGNFPVRVFPASLLAKTLTVQAYVDGSNPNAITAAAARLLSFQTSLSLGAKVYSSRVIDELVNVAAGVLGVSVIDGSTGLPLADFSPLFSDAIVFTATFTAVQV